MDEKKNEIILFENQGVKLEVNVKDETVWLTQKQMAELFDKDRKTITRHIQNIYKDGELEENSVCSFFEHTADDGKKYKVQYYNLDMIISVGYRVNSKRGIIFRKWATKILKDYLLKGYVESKSSYSSKVYLFPDLSNGNFIVTLNNQEAEEMDIPFDKNILKQVVRMFRKEKGYTVKYISRWQGFVKLGIK